MQITLNAARKILTDLGYEVVAFNSVREGRIYHAERRELAKRYDLPAGDWFDLAGLKAFCLKAVGTAGCTALPTL
jgi:hypothetical protein|tara:strand:- start:166 stop:390 length:225 start_codon:yes stop_codon:yes gene_type:complete